MVWFIAIVILLFLISKPKNDDDSIELGLRYVLFHQDYGYLIGNNASNEVVYSNTQGYENYRPFFFDTAVQAEETAQKLLLNLDSCEIQEVEVDEDKLLG